MKFHDSISATEISSQFNIQHFYVTDKWTVKIAGFIKAEEKSDYRSWRGRGERRCYSRFKAAVRKQE